MGYTHRDLINELKESGLDQIQISLDGDSLAHTL